MSCHVDTVKQDEIFGPEQRFEQRPDRLDVLDLVLTAFRQKSVEPLERVQIRIVENGANPRQRGFREPRRKRFEQRLLGGEIVIKSALRDAGSDNHLVEARVVIAALEEQRLRTVEQLVAAQFGVLDDTGQGDPSSWSCVPPPYGACFTDHRSV